MLILDMMNLGGRDENAKDVYQLEQANYIGN